MGSINLGSNGTITNLAVGGLPDGTVDADSLAANAVVTGKITDATIAVADLSSDVDQGRCKAWINFNGTGTPAARDSYNVASITDNSTGDYTIVFSNAMSSTNYVPVVAAPEFGGSSVSRAVYLETIATDSCRVETWDSYASTGYELDPAIIGLVIFGDS